MKKIMAIAVLMIFFHLTYADAFAGDRLMLFCGAGFKQPMNELIQIFKEKEGIEINSNYSGMGTLYSQILFSKKGDVFIVPSPDLMEKAKSNKLVHPDSVANLAYIAPVINVRKGNPKKIRGLEDLARPGIKIALGNPKTVFIGMLAVEIIDKELSIAQKDIVKKNMAVYTEDFAKLSFLLLVGQADAIIGLHYLAELYPDKIESVKLKPEQVHRIGAGQAAVLCFSKNVIIAKKFIDFLLSAEGQAVFIKYHYFSTKEKADAWVGASKPVGGAYEIPQDWFNN